MARPHLLTFVGICLAATWLLNSPSFAGAYTTDQVLLKFSAGATTACKDSSLALVGGTLIDSVVVAAAKVYVVELPDTSVLAATATLAGRACVQYAQPNYTVGEPLTLPDCDLSPGDPVDDPFFCRAWHLKNTGAPWGGTVGADIGAVQGWKYINSSPSFLVAVMDTGIDSVVIDRPDLIDNIYTNDAELPGGLGDDLDDNGYPHDVHGWDFYNNDNAPEDRDPHGTSVASVLGAEGNNGLLLTGVTWHVQMLPVKMIQNGSLASSFNIYRAFVYAVDSGAKIINCSWRKSYNPNLPDHLYLDALRYARANNVLIVAAAGNGTDLLPGS